MADIKWIKLATNMHDDEKIKLIDAMPQRDTIHYVWIRILLLCGKLNADGEIFLSEGKPLTAKMLAALFSRPLEEIKIALKVLSSFGMIEITSDKIIRIVNWDKHQNIEGMEKVREQNRKRAENHREKKKQEKKSSRNNEEEIYVDEELEENKDLEENGDFVESIGIDENKPLEHKDDEDSINFIGHETNNDIDEVISDNIVKTNDNSSNFTKKTSNVTQNESNVTVTVQNKKEIENKKKNKNEKKEIDKENDINKITEDIKNKQNVDNENVTQFNLSQSKNINEFSLAKVETDIDLKAIELMQYHEKITGKVGGCDYVALRSAINTHGEKYVKMAMDIGFENNCKDIKYAIGVLKNWRKEGYPKDAVEVKKNGFRGIGKNNTEDKNKFAGFKPKEPRKLTDAERKRMEANLI